MAQYTQSEFKGEDVSRVVAPLFQVDPDTILHDVVLVYTDDGKLHAIGCEHADQLLFMAQFGD